MKRSNLVHYDAVIDVSNDDSPIPMIRTSEILDLISPGGIVKVIAGKEAAVKNIKTLIANNPYELLDISDGSNKFIIFIKKL
jgi:tRNA 2-thiouridine synthesizing protein A